MPLETAVMEALAAYRSPVLTKVFLSVTAMGSITVIGAFLAGLYFSSERRVFVLSTVATAFSGALTFSLKRIVGRMRPEVIVSNVDPWSMLAFPSGHTTVAFSVATVLAHETREKKLYVYSVAALIGISRIYLGLHYPTDVIAGAFLGYSMARTVLDREQHVLDLLSWKSVFEGGKR
ncbi:MAG: phosphatase PAP2 family protein [Candidatus Nanohaloarchaea archaeon]